MLLFRGEDDLYVPHSICDYREAHFPGLTVVKMRAMRQTSPFVTFVPFLEHVGISFKRNLTPILLNFDLNIPPRVTVSTITPELRSFATTLASILTKFLESNYRFFNGETLLSTICPSISVNAAAILASEMQQLSDAYFRIEFSTLGRPADLAI